MSRTRNQGDENLWPGRNDRRFNTLISSVSTPKTTGHRSPTAKQLWTQICEHTATAVLSWPKKIMGRFKG